MRVPASLGPVRGRFLCPHPTEPRFSVLDDGLLVVAPDGRIASLDAAPVGCAVPETRPGAVWLPGFVDTHIHYPQTRVLGSATGPLLDWLATTVFPEEARFREAAHAAVVAEDFCAALVAQGTTCASVYSSSDPGATEILFSALDRHGLRGQAGLTLMDRGAPPELLSAAGPALEACERLAERWHGHDDGRLAFCVTPRFALSCSAALLRGAAELAERRGLPVQTHLSENLAELAATATAFPQSVDYLGVYADHGLAGPRSIFAHCIHLSTGEWDRMAALDCAVSHCPDSNFFLGSGLMPLRAPLERGLRVGLGTDMGAGRTFSMRRIVAGAYDAALLTGSATTAEALLWRATRGGALALGVGARVGCLAPGFDADVVAIDLPPRARAARSEVFDALAFRRDHGAVAAVAVRGRLLRALDDQRPAR